MGLGSFFGAARIYFDQTPCPNSMVCVQSFKLRLGSIILNFHTYKTRSLRGLDLEGEVGPMDSLNLARRIGKENLAR